MKSIITVTLFFICVSAFGQNTHAEFDGSKWVPPYMLDIPKGWDVERFLLPIDFAPQIQYKGVEDIRFAPGWGDSTSSEYWSYSFLWYMEGRPEINADIIASNLQYYYKGLIGRNIEKRNIPADKIFTPKTAFEKIKTSVDDKETFQGTIYMLDYMQQKPVTLNAIVHLKACETVKDKTFVFYEISPKPLTDDVWKKLDNLCTSFKCNK